MDVIGCLEYDPDLQTAQQHRQFLSTAVVFKEVVPITSQDVLSKIHQTYRIQYLKDVILPRRCVVLLTSCTYGWLVWQQQTASAQHKSGGVLCCCRKHRSCLLCLAAGLLIDRRQSHVVKCC